MPRLYLDFESQSSIDLRKEGVVRYWAHPSTRVLCAGWAVDGEPARISTPGEPQEWLRVLDRPDTQLVVHNASFELEALRRRFHREVPLSRVSCTMARAARRGLPRSLEECAKVLEVSEKDGDGHRVMMKLARERRPSEENPERFWTPESKPEDFARLHAYCLQDVEVERQLDRLLPELESVERALWELTLTMNARGLRADVANAARARDLALRVEAALSDEFHRIVGVSPRSPKAAGRLGLESLDKLAVRRALQRNDLSDEVRRALHIRRKVAKSSVKKLDAILAREYCGLVHGSLTYCGAERTGRWAGAGIQPQNFTRGMKASSQRVAFAALEEGELELLYDDPLSTLSEMLRGFILGPLLVGDYASVEACGLAWAANETKLLDAFRSGADVYCAFASEVFHKPISKADAKERFLGKQGVLGCGYGIGPDKMRSTLDEQHDTQVSVAFAEHLVHTYRKTYRNVVAFWSAVERAFRAAVLQGKTQSVDSVTSVFRFGVETYGARPYAWVQLPSGRRLYYLRPQVSGGRITYVGRNQYANRWERVETYGGKLVENIVQGLCRDLLGDAMLRLEREGFPLVLTVHDEVVAEGPPERLPAFHALLNAAPSWASGLPLRAETFAAERYHK